MATSSHRLRIPIWILAVAALLVRSPFLTAAEAKNVDDKVKEIAGTSEFLRSVPKYFGALKAVDPGRHRVTLLLEGQKDAHTWQLSADAEIKVAGWWGRLEDFTPGDRIWAWFKINRAGQPVAVFMRADELSEQDIHGSGVTITALANDKITIKTGKGKTRVLKTDQAKAYQGQSRVAKEEKAPRKVDLKSFKPGDKVYAQSAGDRLRLLFDPSAFKLHQAAHKAALRKVWLKRACPAA